MAFSLGNTNFTYKEIISKVPEVILLQYYLNIYTIPCIINSPLRKDSHPSFGIFTNDGVTVRYHDFASKESGSISNLLMNLWNVSFNNLVQILNKDIDKLMNYQTSLSIGNTLHNYKPNKNTITTTGSIKIACKIRDWRDYDISYWESYGISLEWLKYAEIYPISHKIIYKNNNKYVFLADKYAYAFIERKEGNITVKIYQPYNTQGYKWNSGHNSSVISLWTKIPKEGNILCICSSVKDALCLWANTGIPSLATQGEGYNISNTALKNLKERYSNIYILFDNDPPGILNSDKLSKATGFKNIQLPYFDNGKDISDYYKYLSSKQEFYTQMINLFKKASNDIK